MLGQRIKALRESRGLSQLQLAERLGLSRSAVSQIENNERKVCAEDLIKLADTFQTTTDAILSRENESDIEIRESTAPYETKPALRISVPQKNAGKFKEVLLYILNRVGAKPNIGETVLYKLLYFIDFDYYELYEEQLIGATYIKNRYGPTPLEFRALVDKMSGLDLVPVKDEYFSFPRRKYLPLRAPNLAVLSARETALIDRVLARLSDLNAAQISEYSHNDIPWLTTPAGERIPYESVFYRTAGYSARPNEEAV